MERFPGRKAAAPKLGVAFDRLVKGDFRKFVGAAAGGNESGKFWRLEVFRAVERVGEAESGDAGVPSRPWVLLVNKSRADYESVGRGVENVQRFTAVWRKKDDLQFLDR